MLSSIWASKVAAFLRGTKTKKPCCVSGQIPPKHHRWGTIRPTWCFRLAITLSSTSQMMPGPPILRWFSASHHSQIWRNFLCHSTMLCSEMPVSEAVVLTERLKLQKWRMETISLHVRLESSIMLPWRSKTLKLQWFLSGHRQQNGLRRPEMHFTLLIRVWQPAAGQTGKEKNSCRMPFLYEKNLYIIIHGTV